MAFILEPIIRKNILDLQPYSSARHEFTGEASVYLDANENSFGSPLPHFYNRYPDPKQQALREKISKIKGIPANNIFLGNGSDEAIDLLIRICCEPGKHNVIILPPTYGMYEICARINDIEVKQVPLTSAFQPNLEELEKNIDVNTRIIFLCSPNNPTGNLMDRESIEMLLNNFEGLVVVDEAYINYSRQKSWLMDIGDYGNLVVLQTFSKAWGLAGLRLGMAVGSTELVHYLNKVKYPYNVSEPSQQLCAAAIDNLEQVNTWTKETVSQREWLSERLAGIGTIEKVYPSEANFLLVKIKKASKAYQYLVNKGIVVRDRSRVILCDDCLRITIGTPEENFKLLESLNQYKA